MRLFFGVPVPKGVTRLEMSRNVIADQMEVRWLCQNGDTHTMPFENTDESVGAVLVAMKLSC